MHTHAYRKPLIFAFLTLVSVIALAGQNDVERAPRFHARTMTGENFTNETIKGKVVLFEFWTTWCPYCKQEEQIVERLHRELESKGLLVLAVDVGESKKTVQKYLQSRPRSVRIVLNEDTNLAAMYAAKSYPIYVAIDRDGNIAGTQRGAGGERALRWLLRDAGLEFEDKAEQAER